MIHITPTQYAFIQQVFDTETFGETKNLGMIGGRSGDFEVIGCGLDAQLKVKAYSYKTNRGTFYSIVHAKLLTYMDGEKVDNDFDQDTFILNYKQAA